MLRVHGEEKGRGVRAMWAHLLPGVLQGVVVEPRVLSPLQRPDQPDFRHILNGLNGPGFAWDAHCFADQSGTNLYLNLNT